MRVEETVRKCVVFIGTRTRAGQFVPYGTGMIGSYDYEDATFWFIVTAKHVLDEIGENPILVRANQKIGEAATIEIPRAGNIEEDSNNDLALLPISLGADVFDFLTIHMKAEYWRKTREEVWAPGTGDEVCIVGLYTSHYGEIHNNPVVRIGHISAMPGHKIRTGFGYVDGYLIELHSIAGLSGSPVFVTVPQTQTVGGQFKYLAMRAYYPIGILIGHQVVETKLDEIVVPKVENADTDSEPPQRDGPDAKRTGFGVVIPIEAVYAIMESKKVQATLRESIRKFRAASGLVPTSSAPKSAPSTTDENPRHKEDFSRLVIAATKKPQQDG